MTDVAKCTTNRGDASGCDFAKAEPSTVSFQSIYRDKKKRERTRAALLDAAAKLMATKDPAEISISDITRDAGVAVGTFYYHFADKGEIIGETAFRIATHLTGRIHQLGAEIDDPVERIAAGSRRFVFFCVEHSTWTHALGRSFTYLPSVRRHLYEEMSRTIRNGIDRGEFHVDAIDLVYEILTTIAFTGARASLEGMDPAEAGSTVAEMQLRVLGVPQGKAKRTARKPLQPTRFEISDLA